MLHSTYGGGYMTNRYYGYYNWPIGILEIITFNNTKISPIFVDETSYIKITGGMYDEQ